MPNQTKIQFNVKKLVKYFENLAASENYGKSEKNFSLNDILFYFWAVTLLILNFLNTKISIHFFNTEFI